MGRTVIRASQVKEDTLEDDDGNTKIVVEESENEDMIRFDTAGTERMIIGNSGNVGIGTSSPAGILHVYTSGDQVVLNNATAPLMIGRASNENISIDENEIMARDGTTASILHLQAEGGGIRYNSHTVANSIDITDGGDMRIGGGTPIAKLDVAGKIAITTEQGSTPSAPAAGKGWLYSKADGKIYWQSNDIAEVDLTAGGGAGSSISIVGRATAGGSDVTTNNISQITFDHGTGLLVSIANTDEATIALGSHFKTIVIPGLGNANDVVASGEDTLEFKTGTGMSIISNLNDDPKSITFSSFGSDLVNDTSPQLGGDLDLNGRKIQDAAASISFQADMNGSANPLYNFQGYYLAAQGGNPEVRKPAHWAIWNGTNSGNGDRVVFKLDMNHDTSYDFFFPNTQPTTGKIFKVGSASQNGDIGTANMVWGDVTIPSNAPANASAAGAAGQIAYADGFLYICIATNTWQRVAIATWS